MLKRNFNGGKSIRILVILFCIFALVLSFNVTLLIRNSGDIKKEKVDELIESDSILPLESSKKDESAELIDSITAYLIEKNISMESVGVSVRSLDKRKAYSINGDVEFIAASVYKLPLAVLWYDKVNAGEISLDDVLYYDPSYYEPGPGIPQMYSVGSYIPLETLLETMIVLSDNTAGHILFEHLGGWPSFKEEICRYTSREMDPLFFTYENVLTPEFTADVISYVYDHKGQFSKLIQDMYLSQPDNYLNLRMPNCAAQKYGYYDFALNAAGFIEACDVPYSIVVFTTLGMPGIDILADINQICFEYFNQEVK